MKGREFSVVPGKVTYMAQEYRDPMVLTTYVETDQGKMVIQDLIPIGETIIIRRVESEFPSGLCSIQYSIMVSTDQFPMAIGESIQGEGLCGVSL